VLSTPSPEKIQDDIKNWTTEKTKLIVRPHDNPKTHFSIWVSPPTPHIIIPIMVAYPKGGNTIMMGWRWAPEDLDIKAYAALRDRGRKESILRAIEGACSARGLTLGIDPPDIDHLEQMAITKEIPVNDLTKERYRKTILDLMFMWKLLMSQFERL
jgi:hypothetical protein